MSVDSVLNIYGFDLARALKASPLLLNANAPMTKHDGTVTSVSLDQSAPRHLRLVRAGELDMDLLRAWITEVLRAAGNDMFRMKGILAIAHSPDKCARPKPAAAPTPAAAHDARPRSGSPRLASPRCTPCSPS